MLGGFVERFIRFSIASPDIAIRRGRNAITDVTLVATLSLNICGIFKIVYFL